jgi:tetratricopeptide (TPR) repeat protein
MRKINVFPGLALLWTGLALAAGGGSLPADSSRLATPPSPEEQALMAYNTGVKTLEKAIAQSDDAVRQTDARRRDKGLARATSGYRAALRKFERATVLAPRMHEAWNYVGFTRRKLGDHPGALAAYDRALALRPDYAEAIEYRGVACLGLGRLDDAKQAYLTLFARNRTLAAQLLAEMHRWVEAHRGDRTETVEAFASWVGERSAIAAQTAGLTREGAAAAW